MKPTQWPEARARKFRQAAFVYLHVSILYEAAAYVMWRADLMPRNFGPPLVWLVMGAAVAGLVFAGLLLWRNVWFVRAIWLIHGLRLPSLIDGAYLTSNARPLAPSFYLTAIVVVVINLWMLARAAWDL